MEQFLKNYEQKISEHLLSVIYKNCVGCETFEGNQLAHECVTNSREENLFYHFSESFDLLDKEKIVSDFRDALWLKLLSEEVGEAIAKDLLASKPEEEEEEEEEKEAEVTDLNSNTNSDKEN